MGFIRHASVDELNDELVAHHCTPPNSKTRKRSMLREHYTKVHGLRTKKSKKRKSKSCNAPKKKKQKIIQDKIKVKVEVKTEDQHKPFHE